MKNKVSIITISAFVTIITSVFAILGTNLKEIFNPEEKGSSLNTIQPITTRPQKTTTSLETNGIKDGKTESIQKIIKLEPKKYFDQAEILPGNKATALFIKSTEGSYTSLQTELSQALIGQGIFNSTRLFHHSGNYYDNYLDANPAWLTKINIAKHTPSYIIGKTKENISISSANDRITIVSLSFSGRYVDTKSNRIIPISIKKENSSFKKENAFSSVYKEMSDSIANLTKFLMTK